MRANAEHWGPETHEQWHRDTTKHEDLPMRIYIGNLAYTTTEQALRQVFAVYGVVDHVTIPQDRELGRPRGFGFVEMPHPTQALAAIHGLNGTSLGGRTVTVNEARPQERTSPQRPRQERRPQW